MKPTIPLLLASSLLFLSCKDQSTTEKNTSTPTTAHAPSDALKKITSTTPGSTPAAIAAIRATAKPGEEITITGRVMGNEKPFVEGRAVFILADPSILTACNDRPGDNCETPWDNCCNTAEEKKKAIATIQVVGTDGRVLKENIENVAGIKKLSTVTVTGKVAEGSSADSLVINATAVHAQ